MRPAEDPKILDRAGPAERREGGEVRRSVVVGGGSTSAAGTAGADGSSTDAGVSRGSAFFDGNSRKPSFGAVRGWSVTASRCTSALVRKAARATSSPTFASVRSCSSTATVERQSLPSVYRSHFRLSPSASARPSW